MVNTVLIDGLSEGACHVLLARDRLEILGTPFAREDEVTHGLPIPDRDPRGQGRSKRV